ncbi:hypothetical protein DIURU_000360 [Diutina rugosa]|uniref:FAD/NAD(P)-binding domain-containing protein n=1 Tax=Diutina rugosa TaxID=5481 RepID=A0A642UY61_DIURU|nr:uncharacterized protein DIURU_000360 [Diutina rugosa]KAA8907950.1 hypothetical protein DIURU_000360 [Diutina rugosa]
MTKLDIKSVGIIGGGPGGLAALYEFLHTKADGTSTVGKEAADPPAFTTVDLFERKGAVGGIWSPGQDKPDALPEQLSDDYNQPDAIWKSPEVPEDVGSATEDKPLVTESGADKQNWQSSGVFPGLFTNIPSQFTRFSYLPDEPEYHDKTRQIYPFLTLEEQQKRFSDFVKREHLDDHIHYYSDVVKAEKVGDKWKLTIHQTSPEDKGKSKWFTKEYDAIVVANGHYTVPNIPHIEGLQQFHNAHPGAVLHAKSYRGPDQFKGKRVLVVGGSISTVNQLQYIVPVAESTVVSRRGPHIVFEWINDAIKSKGITSKPAISKFEEDGTVVFSDGSKEEPFDYVVLTTGYHYYYPFLKDDTFLQVKSPSNLSRVSGLYYDTFSIADPTLGIVGVAVSSLNFHTIEASAAALAGVWSGATQLPPPSAQIEREQRWIDLTADNLLFHYYRHYDVKDEFVDKLKPYAAKDRPYVLREDGYYIPDIAKGFKYQKRLFYGIKDGDIPLEETVGEVGRLEKPVYVL